MQVETTLGKDGTAVAARPKVVLILGSLVVLILGSLVVLILGSLIVLILGSLVVLVLVLWTS